MKILLAPIFFVYKLWIGFVFWMSLLMLYPLFRYLLAREERYPLAFKWKKRWGRIIRFLIFCPLKREVRSALPKPPYIIVSNHSSHLDTVFMYEIMDDYFLFIGKGELLKWPLFGLFFRTMDIPVNRENSKSAWKSMQLAYEALNRRECVALYPEGTIPLSSPRMKSFKNGAFRMAVDTGCPILPITWQSNYRVMNNPEKIFSPSLPNVVRVIVHPPVYPKGKDEANLIALRNEVFRIIDSELPPHARRNTEPVIH